MIDLYKVGGVVRDELLGVKSNDIDYSVVADSFLDMEHWLADHSYEIFLTKEEYGTIRAKSPDGEVADFVLARRDGYYSDGRHPDEVLPGSLYDDLARRDFTMNAIAKRADGLIIDPFGGRADIEACIIRAVGDPVERINEDALRALRAVRFQVTKGFRIEPDLKWAIRTEATRIKLMESVPAERIHAELFKMFKFEPLTALEAMTSYPTLFQVALDKGVWLKPTLEQR